MVNKATRSRKKARARARAHVREKSATQRKALGPGAHGHEISGIVTLAAGLFALLSLFSLQFGAGNLMGPLGAFVAEGVYGLAGLGSYLLCAAVMLGVVRLLLGRRMIASVGEAAGGLLGIVSLSVLLHVFWSDYRVAGAAAGGAIGEMLAEVLRAAVSVVGTVLVGVMGLVLAVVATTPLTLAQVGRALRAAGERMWRWTVAGARWALGHSAWVAREVVQFLGEVAGAILPDRDDDIDADSERHEPDLRIVENKIAVPQKILQSDTVKLETPTTAAVALGAGYTPTIIGEGDADEVIELTKRKVLVKHRSAAPVIVESRFHTADAKEMKKKEKEVDKRDYIPLGQGKYKLPPLSLLAYDDTSVTIDRAAMTEMAERLVTTLNNYKIVGEITAIRPGPVVTMYEFAPAPGTRVSKISNLQDDLAMSLEAISVRIIAPIPGKAVVGIEVPNRSRETVYLKEIIAADVFQNAKSKLSLAAGKDNEGRPVAVDLAKMPHLLVAGTTGSGKSVAVNSMIASLLYSATPEEVRMIMVDPKMLELSMYEGIPHLLLPVVTDPSKANIALRWAVQEMERRYQRMADMGVKDLITFNKKVDKKVSKKIDKIDVTVEDEDGNVMEETQLGVAHATHDGADFAEGTEPEWPQKMTSADDEKKMPYIVIIIDEFADLMMCAAKEVEHSVTRLAQKARACGIHLILATQRPTTEVITGLIKSNIPSRMAFRVTNKTNSIAVLEQSGAEALLGQGDMLFSDRGQAVRRVHGCLVQDAEIQNIVQFLKKQAKPVYDMDILKTPDEDSDRPGAAGDDDTDEMYDRAVALVAEKRQASISMIQRHLRVGYNRAARMVEKMEEQGIVGPSEGSNRREVLVQAHQV